MKNQTAGEHQTVGELLETLRHMLKPQGTAPVVKLELGGYGYVRHELVEQAIDQLEKMMLLGIKASPLETLGIQLLLDSIYYERKNGF